MTWKVVTSIEKLSILYGIKPVLSSDKRISCHIISIRILDKVFITDAQISILYFNSNHVWCTRNIISHFHLSISKAIRKEAAWPLPSWFTEPNGNKQFSATTLCKWIEKWLKNINILVWGTGNLRAEIRDQNPNKFVLI